MVVPSKLTSQWLWAAAAAILTVTPAWADGELDTSFGTNGIVKIAFPGSSHGYLRDIAVVNGFLEAAGYERESEVGGSFLVGCSTPFPDLFIVKVSLSGAVVGAPSSYGQQIIKCPSSLLVDSATGDIYVSGYVSWDSHEAVIAQFDSSGNLIASFPSGGNSEATRILLDNQARLIAPSLYVAEFGLEQVTLLRLSAQGGQLTGGFLTRSHLPSVYRMSLAAVTQDASSGAYYVGGAGHCQYASSCPVLTPNAPAQFVMRLNADSGSLDTNYGSGGVAAVFSLPSGELNAITLDGSSNVLIGGDAGGMDVGLVSAGYVVRLDPSGAPDPSFGTQGVVQNIGDSIVDVRSDARSRVYALASTSQLLRFKVNGTPDASFSSSSNVQTLNGGGSSWQSIQFADSSRSSVYLVGGAAGCQTGCSNAATTALIAKVTLGSNVGGPGLTTTVLNSSATTIDFGQPITLTATVTGARPTGVVTFKDGPTTLATESLSSGSASYSTSTLALGSHTLTAAYAGDSNNAPSTSQRVTETVALFTTSIVLTASAQTATSGQSVTFFATVTGADPAGTVVFSDGNTVLATVNLSSGLASYSTAALAVGLHNISATFHGDNNHAASTATLVETIRAAAAPSAAGGSGGGGGSIALIDLAALLCVGLWRALAAGCRGRGIGVARNQYRHVPDTLSVRGTSVKTCVGVPRLSAPFAMPYRSGCEFKAFLRKAATSKLGHVNRARTLRTFAEGSERRPM
jgi:hypothetical protein